MCITYTVGDGLYVNVTNRCSNRCEFCIRNNGDGAYGSDSLWLEREPTAEEIADAILARELSSFSEVVFCGYGEPSYRLDEIREAVLRVKELYPRTKFRINTNGHSDLIFARDSAPDYEGIFDVVSISLNTPSPEHYASLCHPVFKDAHEALISFAERVKKYVPTVMLSVVRETLTEAELAECYVIAERIGVTLKVRDYISE
ncbi:MAG: radical SAM protein [Clostridia bacterium]|nr:radical SAM protein [Clostridia bacterium]